jgi:hypothetical protein
MKTFFGRLFVHFDFLSHPAEGSLSKKGGQRKRKAKNEIIGGIVSPDSVYMRGPSSKKGENARRTPAP